jgi:hypothetical protein
MIGILEQTNPMIRLMSEDKIAQYLYKKWKNGLPSPYAKAQHSFPKHTC